MILLLTKSWVVLMSSCSDSPQLTYTIRPWVKTGLSLHDLSSPILTDPPKERPSSTIRLVDASNCLDSDSPPAPRPSFTPSTQDTPTPCAPAQVSMSTSTPRSDSNQDTPERRTPRAVLFGPRDKNSSNPRTPSTGRPRGKTVPMVGTSPKTPENRRTDSALSWTPSTSSKHLTSWFSGLLGR